MGKLLDKFNKTKDDGKKVVTGNSANSFQVMANIMAGDGSLDKLEKAVGQGDKVTNDAITQTVNGLLGDDYMHTGFTAGIKAKVAKAGAKALGNFPNVEELANNYKLQRLIDTLSNTNFKELTLDESTKNDLDDFTGFLSKNFQSNAFKDSMEKGKKNLFIVVDKKLIKDSNITSTMEFSETTLTNLQQGMYNSLHESVRNAITATNDVSVVDPTTEVTAPTTEVTAQQVGTEPTSVQATSVKVADTLPVHAQSDVQSRSSVMRESSMDDTAEALNDKFISPVPVAKAESPMPQLATNKTYFSMFMNAINTLVQGIANMLSVFSNPSKSPPAKTASMSFNTTEEVSPPKPPRVSSVGNINKIGPGNSKGSSSSTLAKQNAAHLENTSHHKDKLLAKTQPQAPNNQSNNRLSR